MVPIWWFYLVVPWIFRVSGEMSAFSILEEDMTPQGALDHLVNVVLPNDTIELQTFFQFNGITDLDDFMSSSDSDFNSPYSPTILDSNPTLYLSSTLVKKLLSVQLWYATKLTESENDYDDLESFFGLSVEVLNSWRRAQNVRRINAMDNEPVMSANVSASPVIPPTPTISNPVFPIQAPVVPSFRHSIKINISDYPKLKEESQWRTFHRQLRATAASHDTLEILDPNYVPPAGHELAFEQKQKFMYNVFTNIILTSKGKVSVRAESETLNAQKVYASLVEAYNDQLSSRLSASKLRSELTVMRLDSKWRKGFETFLHFWTTKIQELESIEDKSIDDDTKRTWLIQTLESQEDMNVAIRQAITTELTIGGFARTAGRGNGSEITEIPWNHFYNMVLSTAKMLDNSKSKQTGRPQEANRSSTRRNVKNANRSQPAKPFTKYTGPSMVMQDGMKFSEADWKKLTKEQKSKLHELKQKRTVVAVNNTNVETPAVPPSTPVTTAPSPIPATTCDVRHLLSHSTSRESTPAAPQLVVNGRTYTLNFCSRTYSINNEIRTNKGALIDGGANGGLSGSDVVVLAETMNTADVTGIADNTLSNLKICTVAALIETQLGPIIGIFHQYAHRGSGKTIHSVSQLRQFGTLVDDTPRKHGGKQRLQTLDGYIIPLSIRDGLPYMDMSPPTDKELAEYPHVFFTADIPWEPQTVNDEYPVDTIELSEDVLIEPEYHPYSLNEFGDIEAYHVSTHPISVSKVTFNINLKKVKKNLHDPDLLSPNFGFAPVQRIEKTLENTTQFARVDTRVPLRKHYKSRFPAANVSRLNEVVATDTFFFDVPALDDGIMGHGGTTMVQLFCGCTSLLTAVYSMSSETQISGALEDFIRHHGAPNALFSDNAKAQTGKAVQEILRMYAIKDFQCEPHHQHQNFAERRIQEVKKISNLILDNTGAPPNLWLLCVNHVVYILNRLSTESLGWKTPLEAATGQQPDISCLLTFRWYEQVYFKSYASAKQFPSKSSERLGYVVGVAEHQGDSLTFLVLDSITFQVVARSELRSAASSRLPNLRSNSPSDGGESVPVKPIMSSTDLAGLDIDPSDMKLPHFSPDELLGRSFVRTLDDGRSFRATILRKIQDMDEENHQNIKFLVALGDGEFDEIISYNKLSNLIEELTEEELQPEDKLLSFESIEGHQDDTVLVKWGDGTQSYEPLEQVIRDDPVTVATYGKKHHLLDKPIWKQLKHVASKLVTSKTNVNHLSLEISAAGHSKGPIYQFGIQVPRNVKDAYELDKKNGNTKWADAMQEEINSLLKFNTFKDMGKLPFLAGYKNIRVHFVFAVKHDLRHKARLVAGGHLTDPTTDGTYSSVVSLQSMRIAIAAAELNNLEIMVGDVSSAYLEAYTQEKVCFLAGPEFGPLEGHLLVIVRALYGLRTSGARWHDRLSDVLQTLGFYPCKADPDVWLKECDSYYEYVLVYVDDLMLIGKNPQVFFDSLINDHGFQLKGVGKPSYHLGGDFFRDSDGTLAWGANSYVKKMLVNYETMFGSKPKEYNTPMEEKDHPEIDNSELLDATGIKQYQSLIGALQWLVTLGRFDIQLTVASMSSYRVAPRIGHLNRLKRVYGYLKRNSHGAIRFRVKIPDHESVAIPIQHDWGPTIYGDVIEELPPDMPTPKGKAMRLTTYQDANLYHDLINGRAMSGILHFVNQTPIAWFAKKQKTVETATYGSEFMVARQACEQIMALRYTLRMMGIPIDGPTWMFGDNASVITSSTVPQSTLNKRHNALSYHRVRECIASKIIYLLHVDGTLNPSDALTKALGWVKFWPLIQPLLFWKGETILNTPYPMVIKDIKNNPSSTLRGVSDGNCPVPD